MLQVLLLANALHLGSVASFVRNKEVHNVTALELQVEPTGSLVHAQVQH